MRSIMMQIATLWTMFGGAKMQQMLGNTMEKMVLIMTTFSTAEDADAAIIHLLEQRAIACGSVLPGVTSTYRWNNAIERSSEVQVLLKAPLHLCDTTMETLASIHPYEIPEIICIEPGAVHAPYLAWTLDACRPTT